MSIIKMNVTAAAAALVSVSIDVPADGVIRTIAMGSSFTDASPVTNEGFTAELSFLSTPQFTANDVRGSLCQVSQRPVFVDAARIVLSGVPFCILTPIAILVSAGERIFLHLTPEGSVAAGALAYLFIDDGLDVARAQVRRR